MRHRGRDNALSPGDLPRTSRWANLPSETIALRARRLKMVFEARGAVLRDRNRSISYGEAVYKYDRARTAWRAFRG